MLDIMYEIPKDDNIGSVTITKAYIEGKGSPMIAVRGMFCIAGESVNEQINSFYHRRYISKVQKLVIISG